MGVESLPPVGATTTTVGPWWESRLCVALVVLTTMIPLVYPAIPPLDDLLGHMGRYRVELDLDRSPWLQRYYDYHWAAIGNLGVDLLVIPLGKLLGLEPAVKLIVLAIPPMTAAGFLWVAREVHGRVPPTAFFALPFIYGYPFLFGFVNFALSVALAFLSFGLWVRLGRTEKTSLRSWLFAPISLVVFFCHTYGWGLLGLMCISADAVRLHDRGRMWWRAGIEAALHASVMALPLLVMLIWRGETRAGSADHWFDLSAKLQWILSALRDRWKLFDIGCTVAALVVIVEARRNEKTRFAPALALSALALSAIFFALPLIIAGSAYADMRFVPYIFALTLLAIHFPEKFPSSRAKLVAAAGIAFFAMRMTSTTASLAIASDEQQAMLQALDRVPRGARVATLVGEPCGYPWALQRHTHVGALVVVRREGFSNDQWLIQGINLLDLKYAAVRLFAADPSELVHPTGCDETTAPWSLNEALTALPRQAFDYVWMIDPPSFNPRLVEGMDPVWHGRDAVLYRIRHNLRVPHLSSMGLKQAML